MKISRSFLATTLFALSVSIGRADCPYSFSCNSAGCTTLQHCAPGEPIPLWTGRSSFVLAPQGSTPNPDPSTAAPYAAPAPQTLAPSCSGREAATATSANERGFLKRRSSMDTFAAMERM